MQELLNRLLFEGLNMIAVYPVENENKYSDQNGNVLPDVILLEKGSTTKDLAYRIHSDIGDRMLYAIDARSKKMLAKDHVLSNGDVIKIVSSA